MSTASWLTHIKELTTLPNQGILFEILEHNQTGTVCSLPQAVCIIDNSSDPLCVVAGVLDN